MAEKELTINTMGVSLSVAGSCLGTWTLILIWLHPFWPSGREVAPETIIGQRLTFALALSLFSLIIGLSMILADIVGRKKKQ